MTSWFRASGFGALGLGFRGLGFGVYRVYGFRGVGGHVGSFLK